MKIIFNLLFSALFIYGFSYFLKVELSWPTFVILVLAVSVVNFILNLLLKPLLYLITLPVTIFVVYFILHKLGK